MERTYRPLGAGIDWGEKPKKSDPVADALEAVAAALASLNRPAPPPPPRFPQQFADPQEMAAAANAGLAGRSNPAPFVVDPTTPDLNDPARQVWVGKVRAGVSTLAATRTNMARHVEALTEFSKVVARPPASVSTAEYGPILVSLERYLLGVTMAIKAEASRQRVMGPD